MLTFEQWQEKSESSLEAAQILIDHDKPVEAVSRAYYAAYQMVTGVLVKLKLNPRTELGNWAHQETIKMYRIHICPKVRSWVEGKECFDESVAKISPFADHSS